MVSCTCDPLAGVGVWPTMEGILIQALLIAGPTASGKSALAIELARRLGGAVINADSMQVYSDIRVLSARPSPGEEALAPHLLFGHVDAGVNYSVGKWLQDAQEALEYCRDQALRPIFVGGTGMYFKALTQGLSDIPAVPDEVRADVRARMEGVSAPDMHALLAGRDPTTAARLRPSDPQRILRALEIFEATGQPLASFQGARSEPLMAPGSWSGLFLDAPREWLYPRIDARFEAMMELGAVEEAQALMARGLDPALPSMRAHGIPGLIDWLSGRISREEAITRGQADTRHYARRQFTFARRQLPGFVWISPQESLQESPGVSPHAGFQAAFDVALKGLDGSGDP
jgi:tRNA dimethylallyltransferase